MDRTTHLKVVLAGVVAPLAIGVAVWLAFGNLRNTIEVSRGPHHHAVEIAKLPPADKR